MITITIGNNWGSIYAEALKKADIPCLMEIDGNTNFTFAEEDYKRAEEVMTIARKKEVFEKENIYRSII